jgi:general secretion pathway protein C
MALGMSLFCGIIAYWASIWLAPSVRIAPAGSLSDQSGPINMSLAQGLFGKVPSAAPVVVTTSSSTVKVLGIVAAGLKGAAVLSIDGKPAKVYLLGDLVDGNLKLLAVEKQKVILGNDDKASRQSLAVPAIPEVSLLTRGATSGAAPATNPAPASASTPLTLPPNPPPTLPQLPTNPFNTGQTPAPGGVGSPNSPFTSSPAVLPPGASPPSTLPGAPGSPPAAPTGQPAGPPS